MTMTSQPPRPAAQAEGPTAVDPATILVVIPTLNEAAHIETTLRQLGFDAPELAPMRIVVADGGSTDGTREIVERLAERRPGLILMDNPQRLQSAGINRAVAHQALPRHRYLVRCDAHALYPPGFVMAVVTSLETRGADGLAVVMDSIGEGCFQRAAAWAADSKAGSGGSGHRGGAASGWVDHGHHAGFRLARFQEIGGYAEEFAANEDAEFDHRLRMEGGRIWLDASLRLGYFPRRTPRALARQYWRYGRGRARTVLRHRMRPRLRQVIPVILTLGVAGGAVLAPVMPALGLIPLGYGGLLLWLSLQAALTRRSACGLWVGVALAAMHLPWGAGFLWQSATARGR
jgi:succinoglycan biosynthesis protein ExoA